MSNDQDISLSQFEDIERYLLQEMEPEEATAFAVRLSPDAVLKAKTDELRLTFLAIQEGKLQSRLNQFHQHEIKTASDKKVFTVFSNGTRWLAAASIILVAAIAAWLFLKPASGEALYAAYFKPDDGPISAIGI